MNSFRPLQPNAKPWHCFIAHMSIEWDGAAHQFSTATIKRFNELHFQPVELRLHPASTRKPQVALNWPERTASVECDRGNNRLYSPVHGIQNFVFCSKSFFLATVLGENCQKKTTSQKSFNTGRKVPTSGSHQLMVDGGYKMPGCGCIRLHEGFSFFQLP